MQELVRIFRRYTRNFPAVGSPFYGALAQTFADALEAGDDLAGLFGPWAHFDVAALMDDNTVLRFYGALHDLALSGDAPDFAATFPTRERPAGDPQAAWRELGRLMPTHRARLAAFMSHEPQTNEVMRSACLLPGFLTVARATGLPLRTFEMGASGGLNLNWDRFHYDYGHGVTWGDPAAPVRIRSEWRGAPGPFDTRLTVLSRAACDRRPVRLADPLERRRLKAYIWPGQFARFEILGDAIDAALACDIDVEAADAPAWVRSHAAPVQGAATVVYHSIFWRYMPLESQAAARAAIEAHGAAATATSPFAWLSMESAPEAKYQTQLRLTLWPGGEERFLAVVSAHGAWTDWRGT